MHRGGELDTFIIKEVKPIPTRSVGPAISSENKGKIVKCNLPPKIVPFIGANRQFDAPIVLESATGNKQCRTEVLPTKTSDGSIGKELDNWTPKILPNFWVV